MTTIAMIHPRSFLGYLCTHQPLITSAGKELVRTLPFQRWDGQPGKTVSTQAVIISVDNGNDALKAAMLHARDPFLRTRRLVTAYAPARTIRAGEGVTTWQVNASEPFWIGDDALLAQRAESLPVGMSEERLPDQRYQHFFFACLVEMLIEAGYAIHPGEFQGEYDLYMSLGIPPEELDLRGPKEGVRRALLALLHTSFTVRRRDEQDRITTWTLRLVEITPYPQTFASFASLVLHAGWSAHRDRYCQARHPRYRGRPPARMPDRSHTPGNGQAETAYVGVLAGRGNDCDGARRPRDDPRALSRPAAL